MKKSLIGLCLVLAGTFSQAEQGLERIIVEKYHVAQNNDKALPAGSVTYRIYADMLPGYKFQAVYGVPGHELRITTNSSFYNAPNGDVTADYLQTGKKAANFDSWISVGAESKGTFGVPAGDDVFNTSKKPESVTIVGMNSELSVFDANSTGKALVTSNGSWAALNGAMGPDAETNRVLIAQLTTINGNLSFELNVQIGTPNGKVQQYVAKNAVGSEVVLPSLTYSSAKTDVTPASNIADAKIASVQPVALTTAQPNPNNGDFTLSLNGVVADGAATVELINAIGQSVYTQNNTIVNGKLAQSLNLGNEFPKGVYLVKVSAAGSKFNGKVIIE